ncbi:tRNA (N(6)-L-threonylcarbamoyladenosine(37)-C(2))-methylthiotransferase MtaB [Clostridium hydrogeniformans]|uniref:tRNA (N(6)-L-threonylcarbamoyladenosine(37)-C(2))- methylthiotransferase MtaB n=1 Tax=Clostridium hydrogeniformans TaxID=349933 RepID=UPI0004844B1A|nr:tRNA (N(6)-L-threonylcarbamoyladenosine(37)-C(2))-methylthiotransferase MtaB [Clostridium hydrogeniformans]
MKVAFSTLGCRVNVYESEAMTEKFIREGYEVVDFSEVADVYVINTCTVTNMGDKKSRQVIGRARRLNEDAIIAVVGCYSQIAPKEVSSIEGVDVVLGTRNKGEVVYWVNRALDEKVQIVQVADNIMKNNVFEDLNIEEFKDKTRAFLKVQDGCNRFCSYCLIPYARGGVCSKNPDKIEEEVKKLAEHGFKEVILSGIHTASYGVDLYGNITLVDVLERIEKIEGIERVRIGSIDPNFFTEDVKNRIVKLKKLCPHFHLSLQSGSDETLKRMNRRYKASEYEDIVNMLREAFLDASITTDVIVGFPGETEEEFKETYEFLERIKLSKTHIFKFSPRKGTRAATMGNQVDGNVKEERSKALIDLNSKNEKNFMEKFLGEKTEVLFEEETKEKGFYSGYTRNYVRVEVPFENSSIVGKILKVKIKDSRNEILIGELI